MDLLPIITPALRSLNVRSSVMIHVTAFEAFHVLITDRVPGLFPIKLILVLKLSSCTWTLFTASQILYLFCWLCLPSWRPGPTPDL